MGHGSPPRIISLSEQELREILDCYQERKNQMKLTLHHLPDGTFAAEVPTESGEPSIVFSKPYDSDSGRIDHYTILSAALLRMFGLILPPISETNLKDPGEDTVTVKIAS